ncbi:MAG: formate--phosphoribosylaminoimidazolecarboxamide ligase [Sulfolobales archaeon]
MVSELLEGYDLDRLTIATLASHSSLQIAHGAKKEGFSTLLVVTEDRVGFYGQFKHLVDYFIVVRRWSDLCSREVVEELRSRNSVFVPHGSFVEYVGMDCATGLSVPIFGLRSLFPIEADQHAKMELLRSAEIPTPTTYSLDSEIDGLAIVKLPGAKGGRGYFIASSRQEIAERLRALVDRGLVSDVSKVIIQEYLVGVTAYFHYFYSPVLERLEITGADIRYESDVDGLRRIPVEKLKEIGVEPTFTVVGNIPVVLRESLLPAVYSYGEKFVNKTKEVLPPGVVGPFSLEGVVDRDANIKIFEFSGRIVAGTNLYIDGSPYTYLYWDEPMSVGRRIARELKLALASNALNKVLT